MKLSHRCTIVLGCVLLTTVLSACSPLYVMRAGWEESKILLGRQPIEELVRDEELDEEKRRKFELVLEARAYSKQLGLTPGGSFTQYTDINRDVLLWVLSASSPVEFRAVTWWFPIVGRIPYKGFFDKEDALAEAEKLREKKFDFFLRTSPAFSTLGWFNDPLLSTVLASNETNLVNTVIHEVLHNTVWIRGSVPFNETLANFVGTIGARDFFKQKGELFAENAAQAEKQWEDELLFAAFLDATFDKLNLFYLSAKKEKLAFETIIEQRKALLEEVEHDWKAVRSEFHSKNYQQADIKLNNASIVAYRIYLTKPALFSNHYAACGDDLSRFIASIKVFAKQASQQTRDPYELLERKVDRCLA